MLLHLRPLVLFAGLIWAVATPAAAATRPQALLGIPAGSAAAAVPPSQLRVPALSAAPSRLGTWDAKGRYTRQDQRQRFASLSPDPDIPQYPVVLVHGLFGWNTMKVGPWKFRYFRGVAEELREHGLEVFVPKTTPFASFHQRASELKAQIEAAMAANGWTKVNLVAHSAGGIDCRYLISRLGMADRVASLTTVSSPHRGVWYADFVIKWVFERQKFWKLWDLLGLEKEGIKEISVAGMREFNAHTPDAPGVRYFSFGGSQPAYKIVPALATMKVVNSVAERAAVGKGPRFLERLTLRAVLPRAVRGRLKKDPRGVIAELGAPTDWILPELAGKNDGLVSLSSARWGEYQVDLKCDHLDEMGWFTRFDVKRFYRNITLMLADADL